MAYIIGLLVIISLIWWWNNREKENKSNENIEVGVKKELINTNTCTKSSEPEGLIKRIHFPVVGLKYGGRRDKLTEIINCYKKEDKFYFEPYEGLTNKEIKEDYFSDKIYEISGGLEGCGLEREDDNQYDPNALKVLIKDLNGETHHIGYVPKEHCTQIRELMDHYKMLVASSIVGGKYKIADYDDMGDEKVFTKNSPYGLDLHISFWEHDQNI